MTKIKVTYTGNTGLGFIVFDPTGMKAWNWSTETWITPVTPATDLTTCINPLIIEDANPVIYSGDFPASVTESGDFIIGVYELVGPSPVVLSSLISQETQIVSWNGTAIVAGVATNQSLSSVIAADAYFQNMMYTAAWFKLSSNEKQKALNTATKIIDSFNYVGSKTLATNPHEWPRLGVFVNNRHIDSAIVPQDILYAQYEIALSLAKGIDPEQEIRALRVTSRGFSSVRTTYDPRLIPQYLTFGVPSALGWSYLSTYLKRDTSGSIRIHRVN